MTATTADPPAVANGAPAVKVAGKAAVPSPPQQQQPAPTGANAAERDAMRAFWAEHSSKPTVEAMMLDSQAAQIDCEERPEVS
jgi:hypothetical protein